MRPGKEVRDIRAGFITGKGKGGPKKVKCKYGDNQCNDFFFKKKR